jgi:hypothetical protein
LEDAVNGYDEIRRLLERQREIERMFAPFPATAIFDARRMYDEYGRSELAIAVDRMLEERRKFDALITPAIRDFVLPQTELERAIAKLHEPGGLLNPFSKLYDLVTAQLPKGLMDLHRSEWDLAREMLERSDWKIFADSLAGSSASVAEIWDEVVQFAEEHGSSETAKPTPKGKRRRLALADWMAIVGLFIAILQGVRSEWLAAEAEKSGAKSEAVITATIESSVLLILQEMQRHADQRKTRRWEARNRPLQLYVAPGPGTRRIAMLPLGVEAKQIGRSEDWIQLTAITEKGRVTGWARKKNLDLVP